MSQDSESFFVQSDALLFADFSNHGGDFMSDDMFRAPSPAAHLPPDTNMPDTNFAQTRDEFLASIAREDESAGLRSFGSPKQEPTTSSDSGDFLVSGPLEDQAQNGSQQELQPREQPLDQQLCQQQEEQQVQERQQQQQQEQANSSSQQQQQQQQQHAQNAHAHMYYQYQHRPPQFQPPFHPHYRHLGQHLFHGFSQNQPLSHFQSPWFQQPQTQHAHFSHHFQSDPNIYRTQQQQPSQAKSVEKDQKHTAGQQQAGNLCTSSVLAAIPPPIMQNPIMQTIIPPAPIPSAAKRSNAPQMRPPFLMPPHHFMNSGHIPHYPGLPPPHPQHMLSHSGMPLSLSAPPDMYTMRSNFLPPGLGMGSLPPLSPSGARRSGTLQGHEKEREKPKPLGSAIEQDVAVSPRGHGDRKAKVASSRAHHRVSGSSAVSSAPPQASSLSKRLTPVAQNPSQGATIMAGPSQPPPSKAQPGSPTSSEPQGHPVTAGAMGPPPGSMAIPQYAGPPMHAPNLIPLASPIDLPPVSIPPLDETALLQAHPGQQLPPDGTQQGLAPGEPASVGESPPGGKQPADNVAGNREADPDPASPNKASLPPSSSRAGGTVPVGTLSDGSTSVAAVPSVPGASSDRLRAPSKALPASEDGSTTSPGLYEATSDASQQAEESDGDCLRPLPQLDTAHFAAGRASAMQRSYSSHALGQLALGGGHVGGRFAAPHGCAFDPSGEVPYYGLDGPGLLAHMPEHLHPLQRQPLMPSLGSMRRVQSTGDLRTLHSGVHMGLHHMMTPSPFKEGSFRVGRYSHEERQLRISRYRQKRTERNFNKKIKYSCRKVLADSRPRIRGRFAKNDELDMEEGDLGLDDDMAEDEAYLDSPSSGELQEMLTSPHRPAGAGEPVAGGGVGAKFELGFPYGRSLPPFAHVAAPVKMETTSTC